MIEIFENYINIVIGSEKVSVPFIVANIVFIIIIQRILIGTIKRMIISISYRKERRFLAKAKRASKRYDHTILHISNVKGILDIKQKKIERDVAIERELKKKEHLNKKDNSIIDELYKKRKSKINYALIFEFVGIIFYYYANIIFNTDPKIEILMLLCSLFVLAILLKILVFYRVKKGYYGMNYDECKELMKYIMNDIDRNDIDKGRKIFNETKDYGKAKEKDPVIIREPQY